MGSAASWDCIEGTDVGQIAEPIPDDQSVQSASIQQYCPYMQKGILIYHFNVEFVSMHQSLFGLDNDLIVGGLSLTVWSFFSLNLTPPSLSLSR